MSRRRPRRAPAGMRSLEWAGARSGYAPASLSQMIRRPGQLPPPPLHKLGGIWWVKPAEFDRWCKASGLELLPVEEAAS